MDKGIHTLAVIKNSNTTMRGELEHLWALLSRCGVPIHIVRTEGTVDHGYAEALFEGGH